MKVIFVSGLFLLLILSATAQTVTSNAATAINVTGSGTRAWGTTSNATGAPNGTVSSVNLNNGNRQSQFLVLTNFGFSLPAGSIIKGITASLTRNASTASQVQDIEIRLVKNDVIETAEDKAAVGSWPTSLTAVTYGSATDLWSSSWLLSDINASGFGIAVRAQKTGGGGPVNANVDAVSITIYYEVITPILLTRFEAKKTTGNKVNISWTTSSEENVKLFQIQRSNDGRIFESIISVLPKGDKNRATTYFVTDPSPVIGNNFYRLYEIDLDGKAFFFHSRQVNISSDGHSISAFYNGSDISISLQLPNGLYQVKVLNSNGNLLSSRYLELQSAKYLGNLNTGILKPGVYFIQISGSGINEVIKLFIGIN